MIWMRISMNNRNFENKKEAFELPFFWVVKNKLIFFLNLLAMVLFSGEI